MTASDVGVPLRVYTPPIGPVKLNPVPPPAPTAVNVVALPVKVKVALIMASPGQTSCCGPGPEVCII